jgi:hypothetical protein
MPKTALGRVLLKRGLKKELKRFEQLADPLQVMLAVKAFREGDPNTALIAGRIDELLKVCDQQMRLELNKGGGKMDADRAVQMIRLIDKSGLTPPELEQLVDNSLGRTRRMKFISNEASEMEVELAAHSENWGKDKADAIYRGAVEADADKGGLLNRQVRPKEGAYKRVAEPLGLTEAEYMAIYIFTGPDYKYINPAVANQKDQGRGEDWLRVANLPRQPKPPQVPVMPTLAADDPDYSAAMGKYKFDLTVLAQREQTYKEEMQKYAQASRTFDEGGRQDQGSRDSLMDEGALHGGMLAKALAKLPRKQATLYRGMRITEDKLRSLKVGDTYAFENFTSLSTKESVARDFAAGGGGNVLPDDCTVSLIIIVDLPGWDVKDLSAQPKEAELMIEPSKCRIAAIEDDTERDPGKFKAPPATHWKILRLQAPVPGQA